MDKEPNDKIRRLISLGANLVAGAGGGVIGYMAAGPAGAAVCGLGSTVLNETLIHVGDELADRLLGPRERSRIGAALWYAAEDIRNQIDQGHALREDGFFDKGISGRSDAEEILEAVLLKSGQEPQEKKLPYLGHLFSSVAFDSNVSTAQAHLLTKIADELTYRQFCILAAVDKKVPLGIRQEPWPEWAVPRIDEIDDDSYACYYECFELRQRDCFHAGGGVYAPERIVPGHLMMRGIGRSLHDLLRLDQIPEEDLLPVVKAFNSLVWRENPSR